MTIVDRDQLKRMIEEDVVTTVDVLDAEQFANFHLPGALNVPLGVDFDSAIQSAVPDHHPPVAVYCRDRNCDASPRAAQRMEALGYARVDAYENGKNDWKAAGFPVET